ELLRSLVADDIEAALRELSVDARTIVLLDLEGFTQEELAEVPRVPCAPLEKRRPGLRARIRRGPEGPRDTRRQSGGRRLKSDAGNQ
ncbi:MAG: hypothetical protein ACLP1X_03290, partial [Polyangiaceae bacterium]